MTIAFLIILGVHGLVLVIIWGNLFYLSRNTPVTTADRKLPNLSVLIPVRNEQENLNRLLPWLAMQDYPGFEVIAYDDGSDDDSLRIIQSAALQNVQVITGTRLPTGWIGKTNALLRAATSATGQIFMFLDADVALLRQDSLRRLASTFLDSPQPAYLSGLANMS